jgi:hypothetical protein
LIEVFDAKQEGAHRPVGDLHWIFGWLYVAGSSTCAAVKWWVVELKPRMKRDLIIYSLRLSHRVSRRQRP